MNFDILKKTLEKDERWYKVGELIFPNNPNNEDLYSGYLKLNDIKNEVCVSLKALEIFNNVWKPACTSVTWLEFKEFSANYFNVHSLETLDIDEAEMVYNLSITNKEMIARELAMLKCGWWDNFIDQFHDLSSRRYELQSALTLFRQQQRMESTATDQFKELIFQIDPKYTLEKFHTACKQYHYNDTLDALKTICTNYGLKIEQSRPSENESHA